MANEPNSNSNAPSANGKPRDQTSQQAEQVARPAEIVHEDGRRETVELRAERFWSGALPRPEDLQKYAAIVPDAPERLLRIVEKEQDHRIAVEARIVESETAGARRGQWLGSVISLAALVLAVAASALGAPWQVSVALVGVPVLGVAQALVRAWRHDE